MPLENLEVEQAQQPKQQPFSYGKLFADMVRGGCVGSVTVTTVTPIMNFTNHVMAKQKAKSLVNQSKPVSEAVLPKQSAQPLVKPIAEAATKFTLRRAFDGVVSYNASVVPMIGISLSLNSFFMLQARQHGYEPSDAMKLGSATISGMIAGSVGALPEGIAQAQQLSTPKPRALAVAKGVVQNNGLSALGRGILPTMIRQGKFTVGYMGLMPYVTSRMRTKINNPHLADAASAAIAGLMIGPATAPWNAFRFERQKNFNKAGPAPSYSSILSRAVTPDSGLDLMKAWKPRTLMTACSMFLLHKGKEVYDKASSENVSLKARPM